MIRSETEDFNQSITMVVSRLRTWGKVLSIQTSQIALRLNQESSASAVGVAKNQGAEARETSCGMDRMSLRIWTEPS